MSIMLIPCPFCKTPIPDDCVYCDICGEKLRKCSSCGSFAKSKRCTKCGKPTEDIMQKQNIPQQQPINTYDTGKEEASDLIPDHLVCLSAKLRLGLSHDAIIGRRGNYGDAFQKFPSISGLHAKLIQSGESWKIEDIGSSYGTFLNGERLGLHTPTPIKVGDIIRFADIEFKVTE